MNIGDVVTAVPGFYLRCGSGVYTHAVVVSLDPFVLVSESGDMMWYHVSPTNVVSHGEAPEHMFQAAMDRWTSLD